MGPNTSATLPTATSTTPTPTATITTSTTTATATVTTTNTTTTTKTTTKSTTTTTTTQSTHKELVPSVFFCEREEQRGGQQRTEPASPHQSLGICLLNECVWVWFVFFAFINPVGNEWNKI